MIWYSESQFFTNEFWQWFFFFFHLILTYMVCYVCHVMWKWNYLKRVHLIRPCGFKVKVLLTINHSILCSSPSGGVVCSSRLSPRFLSPLSTVKEQIHCLHFDLNYTPGNVMTASTRMLSVNSLIAARQILNLTFIRLLLNSSPQITLTNICP